MVHVVIPHVVGTVALITIFFVAGLYYDHVYTSLQTEIAENKLKEVANYVASNIIDLVSLCYSSVGNQSLIKKLSIPESVGKSINTVTLIKRQDPTTQEVLFRVRAYLILKQAVFEESELPWTEGGKLKIYTETDPSTHPDSELQHVAEPYSLEPKISVSGGIENFVVWCQMRSENVTIGLGQLVRVVS